MTIPQPVTPFQKAYKHLLRNGIIEKQRDIVEKTGVDKGQLSSYVNTNTKPSTSFVNKFEAAFGIKLADFGENPLTEPPTILSTDSTSPNLEKVDYKDKYIELLEKREKERETTVGVDSKIFEALLSTVSRNQRLLNLVALGRRYRSLSEIEAELGNLDGMTDQEEHMGSKQYKGSHRSNVEGS